MCPRAQAIALMLKSAEETFFRGTAMDHRDLDNFDEVQQALATRPCAVLAFDQPAGVTIQMHAHAGGQLIHAIAGVVIVRSCGSSWVVPTGRAVWVPRETGHELELVGDVQMRTVFVAPGRDADLPAACSIITVSPLLRELILEAVGLHERRAHALDSRTDRILHLIVDEIATAPALLLQVPMPRHPAIAQLCRELLSEPASVTSLESWAASVDMSARTFARIFRRETGMTHGEWCRYARVLLSLPKLAMGESILDVALNHGYDSPSAFSAMFRKTLGMSPSQYFKA
jgi:AraC-like DNA-binding protein/quercetin dioxygenase-like cupin family protein